MFRFILIDHTTDKTPTGMRPEQCFPKLVLALELALETFHNAWYRTYPQSLSVRTGEHHHRVGGEIAINFRDLLPEAPDALAYHAVTRGIPDIEVGVDLFSNLLEDGNSLSSGVTHELFETIGDPGANGWKERQDGSGIYDAEEVCDLVQNTGFRIGDAYASNFLLPSFFIPGSEGPWDYLSVMKTQYDVSNGYSIQGVGKMDVSQVMASHTHKHMRLVGDKVLMIHGELTDKQIAKKRQATSRTFRRGIRL